MPATLARSSPLPAPWPIDASRRVERARLRAESPCGPPTVQQLMDDSHEELTRFADVLSELRAAVTLRGSDGQAVSLTQSVADAAAQAGAQSLTAPILGPEGAQLAILELTLNTGILAETSRRLLLALLQSTARLVSERSFRRRFAAYWVLAALRSRAPRQSMLLAIDGEQSVVGLDSQARQVLNSFGRAPMPAPTAREIFPLAMAPLQRRHRETLLCLRSALDDALWAVLITPPDLGVQPESCGARASLHSRPRLDGLNLSGLREETRECGGFPKEVLQIIEDYVEGHLEGQLHLNALARSLNVSVSHFGRAFRKSTGLTPHTYVLHRRLHRAQELLTRTDLSLADIALATGFADQSHFSRRFHQLVGATPRTFRTERQRNAGGSSAQASRLGPVASSVGHTTGHLRLQRNAKREDRSTVLIRPCP